MTTLEVTLPASGWEPRRHQLRGWTALERGIKRVLLFWHRRSGKDSMCLNWMCCAAHQRVGTYWYMLPEAAQARKAVWDAINEETHKRLIDEVFPKEIRAGKARDNDMLIRLKCGSTVQIVGSDNYDSLVGSPPIGVVLSEWALAKPAAWAYLRPILAKNGGWALFNTTTRGKNHAYRMYQGARNDPEWFAEILTVGQTDVFTPEQLAREKIELIRENGEAVGLALYNQEYLCSFDQAVLGAVYAQELSKMREESRICSVPYNPSRPVMVAHDLGKTDSTALWFMQEIGKEIHWIDYYENSGQDPAFYCDVIQKRGYRIGELILPHDAKAKLLGAPITAEQTYVAAFGRERTRVLPATSVLDGINTLRSVLARSWIDEVKCAEGIDAFENYKYKWVEDRKDFMPEPEHNWASHGSDAGRYGAVAMTIKPKYTAAIVQPQARKRVWGNQLGAR